MNKELWSLAWPVMLTTGASMSLGTIDMIMVGHLGATSIAALSVSVTWMYAAGVFGRNISAGIEPLVSQASGKEQFKIRAELYQHMLRLLVIVLIPQMFLYFFAEQGLLLLGQQPDIASIAGRYCFIWSLAVPAEFLFYYSMRFFQAMEQVRSATISVFCANIINIVANYVCIFAWGLGVEGCALATCISSYCMCAIFLWQQRRELQLFLSHKYPYSSSLLRRIWTYGWPAGLQVSLEVWGFVLSVLFAGWLGTQSQAAHGIVLNISSLCFMIPLGLSVAASTLVGKYIGISGDWKNAIKTAFVAMMIVESINVAILLFCAPILVGFYSSDVSVNKIAIPLLFLCALFQIFDGIQVVSLGILRGMGDVRFPLVFNIVAYWIVGIPLSLWFGFSLGMGVEGIWTGLAIALAIVSALCLVRIAYWMKKGVQSLYALEK